MKTEAITIREGKAEDLPEVLLLIRELAEYERAPLEVSNTVEQMEIDGFGENPAFGLFVAVADERIRGMALYYEKYSTWKGRCLYLEDLVVSHDWRGKGLGKALFNEVRKEAISRSSARLEWQVLNWNEPAIQFYKSLGATLDGEWINGKMTREQLLEVAK